MVHLRAFTKFLFKKYKATVIDDIWPELIFFTGVAVSELHFWALPKKNSNAPQWSAV